MRRWIEKLALIGMLAALCLLSGCSAPNLTANPEDLYVLPTLPARYTELNAQITAILEGGAEYAAPTSGTNIQPVQLVDLDGDRKEEAVAFFRNSKDEKPLKIYIFTDNGDGYRQTDLIEGSGTGVYSVAYNDLDGDGRQELAVGWRVTADVQWLEVYSLNRGGAETLVRTDYVKYTAADLDQDQRQELVVFRADDEGNGSADYYNWQPDGSLSRVMSSRISMTMAELSSWGRVSRGTLQEGTPALFVTGVTEHIRAVTDVLCVKNGGLSNIVLSEATGFSREIFAYRGLYPTDINADGVTEVPKPVELLSLSDESLSYYRVDWHAYSAGGDSEVVMRAYHNLEDGWYFRLPEEWLNRIWISRSTSQDEAVTTFCILGADGIETAPFLRIAAISGSNREMRAVRSGRFLLSRQIETIYTAELLTPNGEWDYGITEDEVRQAFSLIVTEWTSGDY